MSDITLTCPSKAESLITGFLLGAERTIRNVTWRVEYHAGKSPLVWRNGIPVSDLATVPAYAARFVASMFRNYVERKGVQS